MSLKWIFSAFSADPLCDLSGPSFRRRLFRAQSSVRPKTLLNPFEARIFCCLA
jgi:hypothetical protein